jgi:hypothetical protein
MKIANRPLFTIPLFFAVFISVLATQALAQDDRPVVPYSSTLAFGTGLVRIPVAWVSPANGDLFASVSSLVISGGSYTPNANTTRWSFDETLEAHIAGRLSLGASLYSVSEQSIGVFARYLLVRQTDDSPKWLPSLAIGARNIGASRFVDRYVAGDHHVADNVPGALATGRGRIDANPTLYAVATREFKFAKNSASFSIGYGNGLFANSGGLDTAYSNRGTLAKGLFLGGRMAFPVSDRWVFTLMAENDGFDWNSGALITFGHASAGVFVTELEEGVGGPRNHTLANFTKTGIMVGYNASIPQIITGSRQRTEAAEAQLRARRIRQEIAQRTERIRELQDQLAKASQGANKTNAALAAELAKQLEAEQKAMKAATEKLNKKPEEPRTEDRSSRTEDRSSRTEDRSSRTEEPQARPEPRSEARS